MTSPTAKGLAALERGDWESAELAFLEALSLNPRALEANLGMARMALEAGYPEDVADFVKAAGVADPRLAELGYSALLALEEQELAFSEATKFLTIYPEAPAFRVRVGSDLLSDARYVEALEVFHEGGRREPGNHLMAGGEAAACQMLGRMDECRRAVERRLRLLPDDPIVFSHWIALHAGKSSVDAGHLLALGQEWDHRFGQAPAVFHGVPVGIRVSCENERLRVGFVSTTFRHHANCQFLLPLLESLDRKSLAVFAYHDGSQADDVTERCRAAVDGFREIHGISEMKAAEMIRADRIDVLIDINAHFDDARMRLFAFRTAPVQVHYLGGVATTGLRSMDWRLADDLNEPEGEAEEAGTEAIHRIEGGIHAFRPLRATAHPDPLPMVANGFITFGCLNSLTKMEDPVLELWGRCLEAVPGSRLRLVKQSFRREANRMDFSNRAQRLGIDPGGLELLPGNTASFDDLSVYHGIDIALDTFPYNGITTTCEALWMGVPVVTLRGNRFVSREAAGILSRCGHPEWIAETPDELIAILRSLTSDPIRLSAIRRELREGFTRSPVHDAERLARGLESFLAGLF
jgi:protein O-GlcNAc transferase